MNQGVEAGPVDWSLEAALKLALERIIRGECSEIEAAKVRLAMAHPSERLAEVVEAAHTLQLRAVYAASAAVLNEALGVNPRD